MAIPGLDIRYKLPYMAGADKKAKVEVTEAVMEHLRLLTIGELYGAEFSRQVHEAVKKNVLLPKQVLVQA